MEAVSLYRGDFMAGFYDECCLMERERYQTLCLTTLTRLIAFYRQQGDTMRAIEYAQRALKLNPLQEEAHRELIYLHYLNGDRNAALAHYRTCSEALQRELGVEPLPETQALYRQIMEEVERTRAHLELSPQECTRFLLAHYGELRTPFVGREGELKRLRLAWELAASGRGGYALIEGDPGIGKTRLVRELLQQIEANNGCVLIGRCSDWEASQPCKPLVEALRPHLKTIEAAGMDSMRGWTDRLATLFPELGEPRDQRRDLNEALNQLLMVSCQRQPILLFLDDLQWADLRTLNYLTQLTYRVGHMALLVILTYRAGYADKSTSLHPLLETLFLEGHVQHLRLGPLTQPLVTQLVKKCSP